MKLVGHRRAGQRIVYYIPFSKEKVDEIIAKSVGSYKENIIYTFIDGQFSYEFPYDVFVNSSFEELSKMLIAEGGPKAVLLQKQQLSATKQGKQ